MTDYSDNLFYNASPKIHERARMLRKKMTKAEKTLWQHIRNRKLNRLKFRRQHPINIFIADFYCHEKKLVLEIDGGIHLNASQKQYDIGRTAELENFGIHVLRFSNEDILLNINSVLQGIQEACK